MFVFYDVFFFFREKHFWRIHHARSEFFCNFQGYDNNIVSQRRNTKIVGAYFGISGKKRPIINTLIVNTRV